MVQSMRPLLLLLLLLVAACAAPITLKGTALDPPGPAPDFTFTDQQGQPFTLSEHKGKVVLLFFGFTSCPDICPAELANLAAAMRDLGAEAEQVEVALISLDPERDTIERLESYLHAFNPNFIGLRADPAALAPIAKAYGVFYERRELPDSALGYTIDHSGFVYVIDKAGRWREVVAHGTPVEDLVSDLRALIAERI